MGNRLEIALLQCRSAARKGYALARENLRAMNLDIGQMSSHLLHGLASMNSSQIRTPEVDNQLRKQLSSVIEELSGLVEASDRELKERRENLDNFAIALFGRTMAGKSTLMEILTNGDGSSIGTGSQRTTRDVRNYSWQGMVITDIPGVAAFEGKQDEELAYESAKKADLILFLITDDAPQPVEAECLAKILELGKPVIGILNVKFALDDERYMKLFLRNPERPFEQERLRGINQQFNEFLASFNPCARLQFIPVHLRARYLGVQKKYGERKNVLIDASRFQELEDRIIREVTGNGKFYRIRSFIDGSVVPMQQLIGRLLEFSAQNFASGNVLLDKQRQFKFWAQQFESSAKAMIDRCISQIKDRLGQAVPGFVESHYEDRQAGASWEQVVREKNINVTVQGLQRQLAAECQNKLSEIARELKRELTLVSEYASEGELRMEEIHDYKRIWDWGVTIAAGALGIAAIFVSGPLGWMAGAVGAVGFLFSFFFDSREEKAKKARDKLAISLYESINKMGKNLRGKLSAWFQRELINRQIRRGLHKLYRVFIMRE